MATEQRVEPIYIREGTITPAQHSKLQKSTGRPVVLVEGEPSECVLDVKKNLRDYFAGQALIAYMSSSNMVSSIANTSEIDYGKQMAIICYEQADAMLQQRSK